MGYRGGELADLAPPLERGIRRFATRVTRKVGGDLKNRVERRTPVAKDTAAVRASFATLQAWHGSRGGRLPGELKRSWKVGEVEVVLNASGERRRIDVYTLDPVAPHVEWDTRPHLIEPRKPGGVLTIPTEAGMVFAKVVHHPGTRGVHMMATALAEVAVEWRATAEAEWVRESGRIWRAGRT